MTRAASLSRCLSLQRTRRVGLGPLPALALVLLVLTTVDVLLFGGRHAGDQSVFSDGLPARTGIGHTVWRTVVMGGQYWLIGTAAALATAWAAWRARSVRLLVCGGLWLVATELIIRTMQLALGRTPPLDGVDELFSGAASFPSGHAANAAACLTFIPAILAASRRLQVVAHGWALLVAVAVVTLGYHWPTDAVAGWSLGIVLAWLGLRIVFRVERPRPAVRPVRPPSSG
ncbi:membrane-associated phospholipid phosphatase [Actinocorallia herbida]|uniref:Membrane-associated phospholipid phosphatase n=1 Tax=Actinocorallia herbida TaxID=58109 RepID=A0A3N1D1X2_9ACTN|nr:phosphatase PAP2 family protein [Actinocorallia herbida]ROO87511.1 membrane-associated phospholipid phosphatase [Actinocorallia herbida]